MQFSLSKKSNYFNFDLVYIKELLTFMIPNKYNYISYEIFLIVNLFGDINVYIIFR